VATATGTRGGNKVRAKTRATKKAAARKAKTPAGARTKASVRKTRTPAPRRGERTTRGRTTGERPAKTGRPSLLTPEVQGEIVRTLKVGNYLEAAAEYAGIGRSTLFLWLARARREAERRVAIASEGTGDEAVDVRATDPETFDAEQPYVDFLDAVHQAEAEAHVYAVTVVRDSMRSSDPNVRLRAALAFVERKYPRLWSRAERSEVSVSSEQQVAVSIVSVDEQRVRTAETLDVLEEIGAREVVAAAVRGELPSGEDDDE